MDNTTSTIPTRKWLVWSIVVPIVTMLATAAVMSIPPDTQGIDVVAGGEVFTKHCASCHFTKVGFPAHLGPNLHDIGRTAASRKPNQTAAEYILESILDPAGFIAPSGRPGMPPDVAAEIDPKEIRNLVGFLASRGAYPDYEEIGKFQIPDRRSEKAEPTLIRLEDMQLAESVLREKGSCLRCHSLYSAPEGKTVAPGLFGVGLNEAKAIRESIVNPHKEIKQPYRSMSVLLQHGEIVSGQLVLVDDQRLVLRTFDDQNQIVLREIPLTEVEHEDGQPQIRESTNSLMPDGFGKSLRPEEIDAVINLIRQLN